MRCALVALAALVLACSKPAEKPKAPAQPERPPAQVLPPAPPFSWKAGTLDFGTFTLRGGKECSFCRIEVSIGQAGLTIASKSWTVPATISLGEGKWDVHREFSHSVAPPPVPGSTPLDVKDASLRDVPVKLTLTVAIEGVTPIETEVRSPLSVPRLHSVLAAAKSFPVPMIDDLAAPAAPATAVAYWLRENDPQVLGPGKTLREVDWVVADEQKLLETKECKGYFQPGKKGRTDLSISFFETTVSIHDRRTGQRLGSKAFAPAVKCPDKFIGAGGAVYPDLPLKQKWLEASLKAGAPQP